MSQHKKVFSIQHAVTPLTRRYWVDHINLHHTYLSGKWTLDHVESKYKSIRGHTGAIVILNGDLAAIYSTASKRDLDSTESLRRFHRRNQDSSQPEMRHGSCICWPTHRPSTACAAIRHQLNICRAI
jgi:hypothetical protein